MEKENLYSGITLIDEDDSGHPSDVITESKEELILRLIRQQKLETIKGCSIVNAIRCRSSQNKRRRNERKQR